MRKSEYLPSIRRLVELSESLNLSADDKRHLSVVRNWLATKHDDTTSSCKVNPVLNRGMNL